MAQQNDVIVTIKLQGADKFQNDAKKTLRSAVFEADLLKKGVELAAKAFAGIGRAVIDAGKKVVDFMGQASTAATEFDVKMNSLVIISEKFEQEGDKVVEMAKKLGKTLRIGPLASADALQNLLASGLNLKQAGDLLERFTNEAITGKSANIDLSTAVQNLAFAYRTNNSMLGNLSGISENFNNIIDRGAKLMGKKTSEMTEAELEEAKYRGMINLTNLTLGSSERVTTDLMKAQFELQMASDNLKISIGQGVNAALSELARMTMPFVMVKIGELMKWIDNIKVKFSEWWKSNQDFIRPQLERISTLIMEISSRLGLLVGPVGASQEEFNKWANGSLKTTVDRITNLLDGVKDVIDFLKSPEGKKAMADFAGSLNRIADAAFRITSQVDRMIAFANAAQKLNINKGGFAFVGTSLSNAWKSLFGEAEKKAGGGIIGGNSFSGDKVMARMNSGEMVLNRTQQGALFGFLKNLSTNQNFNFNAPISFGGNAAPMQQQNNFVNLLKQLG